MQRTWVLWRRREPSENRRVPSAAEPVMSAPHSALRYRILSEFEREFLGLTKAS